MIHVMLYQYNNQYVISPKRMQIYGLTHEACFSVVPVTVNDQWLRQ